MDTYRLTLRKRTRTRDHGLSAPLLAKEALSVKATDSSAKYELVKTLVTKSAKAI